jgi:nitroimidazol reductase NimA-like FMN-containing flavoprotein (pyridoxamine 5'-phosphate oxidase superfamily)
MGSFMADGTSGNTGSSSVLPEPKRDADNEERLLEKLDEAECLRLIAPGGVGRIAFSSPLGIAVLPVNYRLHEGSIVFRTAQDSPMGEDLRTGIAGAEFKVAFEVDQVDMAVREGWSVLIQGAAHHVDSETERATARQSGVQPWPGGRREHFVQIIPSHITGRRIRRRDEGTPT